MMQTLDTGDMPQQTVGRPVIAEVTASRVEGKMRYDVDWRKEGDPNASKGPIEIKKGERDTPIHFQLRDNSGLNLKFKTDAADSMWVSTTGCPPQGPGNGGQISFNSSSNQLLKVSDSNSGEPCTLYYMLRFDGDPYVDPNGKSYPPYEYDPEIRNGGGN